jgi:hypothetical protein
MAIYTLAIKTKEGWDRFAVPKEVATYVKQLEGYIENPKESKLLSLYPNRFNKNKPK